MPVGALLSDVVRTFASLQGSRIRLLQLGDSHVCRSPAMIVQQVIMHFPANILRLVGETAAEESITESSQQNPKDSRMPLEGRSVKSCMLRQLEERMHALRILPQAPVNDCLVVMPCR